MKISAALIVALLALSFVYPGFGIDPSDEPFQEVRAKAKRLERTPAGKAYEERFAKAFEKPPAESPANLHAGRASFFAVQSDFGDHHSWHR